MKDYSADDTFLEDRKLIGLGVRADYNNKYYADFNSRRKKGWAVGHDAVILHTGDGGASASAITLAAT